MSEETGESIGALAMPDRSAARDAGRRGGPPDAGGFAPLVYVGPGMRGVDALRLIHRTLLERIVDNEQGVREFAEGELLHDFRVAIRRTRTGLRQMKKVYPRQAVDHFSAEFGWLGSATGRPRDLEVYRQALPLYRGELPGDAAGTLDPLVDWIADEERAERARLREDLESDRYISLIDDWAGFIETSTDGDDAFRQYSGECPDALRPVLPLAVERLMRAHRGVIGRGESIVESSPSSDFHRLRLDCKKLRYLLEFFAGLFEHGTLEPTVTVLKDLQDNLGSINDLRVQMDLSAEYVETSETVQKGAAAAVECLVATLEERQRRYRRELVALFEGFAAMDAPAALQRAPEPGSAR